MLRTIMILDLCHSLHVYGVTERYNVDIYRNFHEEVARIVQEESFNGFPPDKYPTFNSVIFSFASESISSDKYSHYLMEMPTQFWENAVEEISSIEKLINFTSPSVMHIAYTDSIATLKHMQVTVTLFRYVCELYMLQSIFKDFVNIKILEIGGGYGGFAALFRKIYPQILKYAILDLEEVHLLQKKYLANFNDLPVINYITPDMTHYSSCNTTLNETTQNIKSCDDTNTYDMVISFFSISEQQKWVVDEYISKYIQNAGKGYLQLNYDDCALTTVPCPPGIGVLTYSVLDLFRAIYTIHPTAVLLPPPILYHHHRIVWGVDVRDSKYSRL